MSLKDDIELIEQSLYIVIDRYSAFMTVNDINNLMDSEYALSRIEAALADILAEERIREDLAKKVDDWRTE